ncbi:MAG: hypothetical protein HYS13_15175 [Planctomycetia bacterium]|nr:hypothetical protein [Planctomycetia bacterium]
MSVKEWRLRSEKAHVDILRLLKLYERSMSIDQEPYKSDFFRVFFDAFRRRLCSIHRRFDRATRMTVQCKAQPPIISGHSIWKYAVADGWVHANMSEADKRYRDIQDVMRWWDDWTYALSSHPPPRMWKRKQVTTRRALDTD